MPAEPKKLVSTQGAANIGERLRNVRTALSLKQVDFASAVGVSQGSLSELESGKYPPNVDVLFGLVRAFPFVDLRWLISGEGSMYVTHVGLGLTDSEAMVVPLRIAMPKFRARARKGREASYRWLAKFLLVLYERYLSTYSKLRDKGVPEPAAREAAADDCEQYAAEVASISEDVAAA